MADTASSSLLNENEKATAKKGEKVAVQEKKQDLELPVFKMSAVMLSIFASFFALSIWLMSNPLVMVPQNLVGKSYLVTNCDLGSVGFEMAKMLLEWNATKVVCTVASESSLEELTQFVSDSDGKAEVELMNFSLLASVKDAVKRIKSKYRKFDGAVINAALLQTTKTITEDGFEEMFQFNHLSPFLLLSLLEDHFRGNARVAVASSSSHLYDGRAHAKFYAEKPGGREGKSVEDNQWYTYADTKFMQVATADYFAERHPKKDITFNSFCPGLIELGPKDVVSRGTFSSAIILLEPLMKRTPRDGAIRGMDALTNPKFKTFSGLFFNSYIHVPRAPQMTNSNIRAMVEFTEKHLGLKKGGKASSH
jgi:NAD(P)-dependent dehydrogenase (short-subunit alcohol dehydrogenase family)